MKYTNVSAIKKYCKDKERRVGKDFLNQIDIMIEEKLQSACGIKNGGKKTLDREVAIYVGFKI